MPRARELRARARPGRPDRSASRRAPPPPPNKAAKRNGPPLAQRHKAVGLPPPGVGSDVASAALLG